jgi:ATP citrate (pro-S)-lyase
MTFVDVVRAYQGNPSVKMIILFGEVGNQDENEIAQLVRDGIITKPIVAWIS